MVDKKNYIGLKLKNVVAGFMRQRSNINHIIYDVNEV
jgi:hypothetical protein